MWTIPYWHSHFAIDTSRETAILVNLLSLVVIVDFGTECLLWYGDVRARGGVKNSCLNNAKSGSKFKQSLTKTSGATTRLSRKEHVHTSFDLWAARVYSNSYRGFVPIRRSKRRIEDGGGRRDVADRSTFPRLRQDLSIQWDPVNQPACDTDQRSQCALLDRPVLDESPGSSGPMGNTIHRNRKDAPPLIPLRKKVHWPRNPPGKPCVRKIVCRTGAFNPIRSRQSWLRKFQLSREGRLPKCLLVHL